MRSKEYCKVFLTRVSFNAYRRPPCNLYIVCNSSSKTSFVYDKIVTSCVFAIDSVNVFGGIVAKCLIG